MSSTRRDFLAAAAVVGFTGAARAQHEPVAFALIGDRYHNSDHYRTAFGKTFVRRLYLGQGRVADDLRLTLRPPPGVAPRVAMAVGPDHAVAQDK